MIRYKGHTTTYGEMWYEEQLPDDPCIDVALYRQRSSPVPGARVAPFLSIVNDLTVDNDDLIAGFGKDCRYKVKRAEARDGLKVAFIAEPAARLQEFRTFYDAFAAEKGLRPCYYAWLQAACTAGQLVLTSATRDGEPLVWHAFLLSGSSAWLQYTGSCFRNRDNEFRAIVGRANRWLHWQEMLHFKAMGMARYDWGGLFEDESTAERAGINRFKKEFGGKPVRRYDCEMPVSLKGRVWLPLRNAWREKALRLTSASPAA